MSQPFSPPMPKTAAPARPGPVRPARAEPVEAARARAPWMDSRGQRFQACNYLVVATARARTRVR